jgi:hypothetical protein
MTIEETNEKAERLSEEGEDTYKRGTYRKRKTGEDFVSLMGTSVDIYLMNS